MIIGTFLITICFSVMNAVGLNSQWELASQKDRYNANYGFINAILSGSTSGLIGYLIKKYFMSSHVGNPLYDMKALCNSFIAGIVGVSIGSGSMEPKYAVMAGFFSAPCYIFGCFVFQNFTIDDPMENC